MIGYNIERTVCKCYDIVTKVFPTEVWVKKVPYMYTRTDQISKQIVDNEIQYTQCQKKKF